MSVKFDENDELFKRGLTPVLSAMIDNAAPRGALKGEGAVRKLAALLDTLEKAEKDGQVTRELHAGVHHTVMALLANGGFRTFEETGAAQSLLARLDKLLAKEAQQ